MSAKPKCFVVMGYKTRTDPDSSKEYDLDKSYRSIIKQAVENAGFVAIRSDEVTEPGMISRQMYQLLMDADLVVCDLTTLNPNALFELGVRMALRPKATVVIAAEGTKVPFNLNQNRFFMYSHGGKFIDYDEAVAAQQRLTAACLAAKASNEPDSLIYSIFHKELQPPSWIQESSVADTLKVHPAEASEASAAIRDSIAGLQGAKSWGDAIAKLEALHTDARARNRPVEAWFTQQWALCTYKQSETSTKPADVQHLLQAREILARLAPANTTDAETLGLWGAVHKRLSEHPDRNAKSRTADLEVAIASYRKGYILRDDHFNGVNYAFLLRRRALESTGGEGNRKIRDMVEATEAWQRVVARCSSVLDKPLPSGTKLEVEQREALREQFWETASLAQSFLGLGDTEGYGMAWKQLNLLKSVLGNDGGWMIETTEKQEHALKEYLAKAAAEPPVPTVSD